MLTSLVVTFAFLPFGHKPPVRHHKHHHRSRHTYTVEGKTSTFGYPAEGGQTADGGNTQRPCIAIRDDSTLGHWFSVTVNGRTAHLLHCDWGPALSTGRSIDITGLGVERLGYSQSGYPTESHGVARELP